MKRSKVLAICAVLVAGAAGADGRTVAEILNNMDGLTCQAKTKSKTVLCVVNTTPSEADKMATGIVFQVNAMDIDMEGWKLTLVTPSDYMVTRRF